MKPTDRRQPWTKVEFDRSYSESFNRLVGHIYAMCGNLPEAQDAVHEAFVRAWDHRKKLDSSNNPEGWVRTTALPARGESLEESPSCVPPA